MFGYLIWTSTRENLILFHVNNKGEDQPALPRSPVSAFVIRYLEGIVVIVHMIMQASLSLALLEAP